MKKIIVFAGLLGAPAGFSQDPRPPVNLEQDPRFGRLQKFFEKHHCPLSRFTGDFLIAADENHLDWRLLPGISMLESGGGKYYRNGNILGWRSSAGRFSSIPEAIHTVANALGTSPLYRNRRTDGILRLYNRHPEFAPQVKRWMFAVSPVLN